MEKSKIQRINMLAKKAKEEGLTSDEKQEQAALRAEYLASIRGSLQAQLDSTVVQEPDGTRHPLEKKIPEPKN